MRTARSRSVSNSSGSVDRASRTATFSSPTYNSIATKLVLATFIGGSDLYGSRPPQTGRRLDRASPLSRITMRHFRSHPGGERVDEPVFARIRHQYSGQRVAHLTAVGSVTVEPVMRKPNIGETFSDRFVGKLCYRADRN
jgi:hypothetical protein